MDMDGVALASVFHGLGDGRGWGCTSRLTADFSVWGMPECRAALRCREVDGQGHAGQPGLVDRDSRDGSRPTPVSSACWIGSSTLLELGVGGAEPPGTASCPRGRVGGEGLVAPPVEPVLERTVVRCPVLERPARVHACHKPR